MGVWNGQQTYFRNGRINLGLWKEAMKGCKEIDMPFILENKEEFPLNRDVTLESVQEFCKEFFKFHKVKTKSGGIVGNILIEAKDQYEAENKLRQRYPDCQIVK